MMSGLQARADKVAGFAIARLVESLTATVRARGLAAEVTGASVTITGRRLLRHWLSDPLLRCLGRIAR